MRMLLRSNGCPDCGGHKVSTFGAFALRQESPREGMALAVPFGCWDCGHQGGLTASRGVAGESLEVQLIEAWAHQLDDGETDTRPSLLQNRRDGVL